MNRQILACLGRFPLSITGIVGVNKIAIGDYWPFPVFGILLEFKYWPISHINIQVDYG